MFSIGEKQVEAVVEAKEKQVADIEKAVVDLCKCVQTKIKVDDLVDNYRRFLENEHPTRVKSYDDLLNRQPASARAEAVAFYFLRTYSDNIHVEEDSKKGGVDFRCQKGNAEFVAEVTCLDAESVARKSGLKNEPPRNRSGGWYSGITNKLFDKVDEKTNQMSGYDCPAILVMTCEHPLTDMLLDRIDAEFLLTGDQKIAVVPFSNSTENLDSVTDLENSVFFLYNQENGKLESCRRSISAILLFSIFGASILVVGILHPDPIHRFPIELLRSVPFVRLKSWPPEKGILEIEWQSYKTLGHVIDEPEPYNFWYDEELGNTGLTQSSGTEPLGRSTID